MPRRLLIRCLVGLMVVTGLCAVPFAAYRLRECWETSPSSSPPSTDSKEPELVSFDKLFAEEVEAGWRVECPLDLPGPYRRKLERMVYYSETDAKSTVRLRNRFGQVFWEYEVPVGHMAVPITVETADGRIAHGLLVRKMR
jgi:hypothetical protein